MQLSLHLPEQAPRDDLAALCLYLRQRGRWTTAKAIQTALGYNDRRTRSLASTSGGLIVSGPGCPGYKHVANCTGPEIAEITARLRAQAAKMASRIGAIHRAWHRQLKPH